MQNYCFRNMKIYFPVYFFIPRIKKNILNLKIYIPEWDDFFLELENIVSRIWKYVEHQSDQNSTGKAGEHCWQPGGEGVQSRGGQKTERFDFLSIYRISVLQETQ